jgi:hypothetical protein
VIENGDELGRLKAHVQGHHHGTNQRRAIVAFEQLIVIEAEKGDAITAGNTFAEQSRRETFATFAELGVGVTARTRDHADFVAVEIDASIEASDRS